MEQVEYVPLHLEPPGKPGAGEASRVSGNRDNHIALRGEPDLGRRAAIRRFPDRIRSVRPEPGHEGNPQVRDTAAERPVREVGRTVLGIQFRDASRKSIQCRAALFGSRHHDLAFKVILRRRAAGSPSGGAATA